MLHLVHIKSYQFLKLSVSGHKSRQVSTGCRICTVNCTTMLTNLHRVYFTDVVCGRCVAGRRATIESESDSNSMDDVEPDSDADKDYDSDKDPAWKPHVATHGNVAATANVCSCLLLSFVMS